MKFPKIILLLLMASSYAFAQDSIQFEAKSHYRKAAQEFEAKNVDAGLSELLKAAEAGYPLAQGRLGNLYLTGEYVKQDHSQALIWLKKAASNGDIDAMDNLGWMYEYGKGVKVDFAEAMKWYNKSDQLGSTYGTYHLGIIYKKGKGTPQDYAKAVSLFQKCAFLNDALCQYNFGLMLDFGYGIKEDDEQANNWYRKAAEQGNDDAQFNLGWNYENGHGIGKNESEAATWYGKAAKQGNQDAQFNLGLMYVEGRGVKTNYSEAAKLFQQAADNGKAKAKYRLAELYEEGKGVARNLTTALTLYREAATAGYIDAQDRLGYILVFGDSTARDTQEGIKWFRRAASQESAYAQYSLGKCYQWQTGVEKNDKVMLDFFEKSAKQGYVHAQVEMGVIYYEGKLVQKNAVEAVKFFRKAADQGSEKAIENIMIIYGRKEINQKVGIPSLDSLLFLPLKHELTNADQSAIRELAMSCFKIEEHWTMTVDAEELLPNAQKKAKEPASLLRAQELLKKLESDPENIETYLSLADVNIKLHKREEGYRYLDKAEAIVKNSLANNPTVHSPRLFLVRAFMLRESYTKALEELEIYAKQEPADLDIDTYRSACLFAIGDVHALDSFYNSEIQKNPKSISGHLGLCVSEIFKMIKQNSGVQSKTIEELVDFSRLQAAVKKYPKDPQLNFLLHALRQMTLTLKIAMEHMSDSSSETFVPKLTQYEKQEAAKLEQYYLSALSDKTQESKFLMNKLLAHLNVIMAQYDNAIKFCGVAMDINSRENPQNPVSSELYHLLSTAYLLRKDTLMAEKIVLEKVAKETETYRNADDYSSLARFSLWKRDKSKANEYCQKALEIDPITQDAFVGLATVSILEGDPKTAKEYLLKASGCGKDNTYMKTLNGIIWLEAGDYKSAQQSFQEALQLDDDFETPKLILKRYFYE